MLVFEYHGWFTVQAGPHATDSGDGDCEAAAEVVRRHIEAGDRGTGGRDDRAVRPDRQFHFSGFTSRRGPEFDALLGALSRAARRAAGSYGLVRYLDDEDPPRRDGFRVLVVRRGQIIES